MIIDLQRQVRQVGRIRIGEQAQTRSGRTAPTKLSTFRITSVQRAPIDKAAQLYGGQVRPMDNDRSDDKWQVTTDATSIPVVIPPTNHLDQWYELWSAAGCERRCDGQEAIVLDGRPTRGGACACDPEQRECRITTRLFVVLPELEALGTFRLETHGWYAATELAGAADLCAAATGRGAAIPARLDLEQRTRRTRDANGKPQTFKFAVPVLSVDVSLPQAQAILGRVDTNTGEIARPTIPVDEGDPKSITAGEWERARTAHQEHVELAQSTPEGRAAFEATKAELPPLPPADIPAPRTHAEYENAQQEPQEASQEAQELPLAGGMTDAQKYAAALPGKLTDDQRHALYQIATGDPTARHGNLDGRQRNQVVRWARQIEAGELKLELYPSGPALIAKDDTIVASAPTQEQPQA